MRKIGIGRGLHSYHHFSLWRTFFTELGFEVVLSSQTDKEIVNRGVRLAPAELCLPVKVFLGQVEELLERAELVFIPRMVCRRLHRDFYFGCPKAIALPDLVRAIFGSKERFLELVIDQQVQADETGFVNCAQVLGISRARARAAFVQAIRAEAVAEQRLKQGANPADFWQGESVIFRERFEAKGTKIGVIGHPYLIYDEYISLSLLKMLTELGVEPAVPFVTVEELEAEAGRGNALNWFYELELIARAQRLIREPGVKGLLLVSSFACGTAPVVNEVIRREIAEQAGLPMLTLLFDEHSGETGLRTRVESFVDLLGSARAKL
jgi:predicted nucleotide-binding protein (sugar kinase/HSP70/actin superfamily)|uniref:DUF2229 domain-containing protein n=1 Tax=candidate division WOR-3 bacterium TaxID=2052148 RepID=A0A7V3PU10_UNCW3